MSGARIWSLGVTLCAAWLGGLVLAAAETAKPKASSSPTPAPVSDEAQSTTATFGDWVVRCEHAAVEGQSQRVCEVAQTLEAKGQGIVAQIALGRLTAKGGLRLTIVLPPNVSLLSGVRVAIDEKDETPVDLSWKRCLPGGCFAEADAREDALKSWRAQTGSGQIRYALASGQILALAFSFRGLGVALDNLAKSSASQ